MQVCIGGRLLQKRLPTQHMDEMAESGAHACKEAKRLFLVCIGGRQTDRQASSPQSTLQNGGPPPSLAPSGAPAPARKSQVSTDLALITRERRPAPLTRPGGRNDDVHVPYHGACTCTYQGTVGRRCDCAFTGGRLTAERTVCPSSIVISNTIISASRIRPGSPPGDAQER
jgi:hypothetical protein